MRNPSYEGLQNWLKKELAPANAMEKGADKIQNFFFKVTPKVIHEAVTTTIKTFTTLLTTGSGIVLPKVDPLIPLRIREEMATETIQKYTKLAIASGAGTGAGGLWIGLLDLPMLMSLKVRMLYEVAAIFGYAPENDFEKLYILRTFQTAFSNPLKKEEKINALIHHKMEREQATKILEEFDWTAFQREYRDYLDLAKLFQLVPGIGAVIGAMANQKLMIRLGEVAIGAYRLRYFQDHPEERVLI